MPGYKRKRSYSRGPSAKRAKKPYTRRRGRFGAKGKSQIAKICRKTIMRMTEPKSKTTNLGKIELNHNQRYSICELNGYMPSLGPLDEERNGDRIYVSGFKVRLLCGQKLDRPNVTWKFWILKNQKFASLANNWRNVTGNVMLDPLNMDQVNSVLYTKTFKPSQSTMFGFTPLPLSEGVGKEYTFTKSFWIPYKKEYKFHDNGQLTHNDDPITMFVSVYDAYGTLNTDNIAYVQVFLETFYRDP